MASVWSSAMMVAPYNICTSKFEKQRFDGWTDGCVRNWQDEQVLSQNQWLSVQVETVNVVSQGSLQGLSIVIQTLGSTKLCISSHQITIKTAMIQQLNPYLGFCVFFLGQGQSLILPPKPVRVHIIFTRGTQRNFSVLFYLNVSKTMLLHAEDSILLHILSLVILALKYNTFNNFEAAGYQKYRHQKYSNYTFDMQFFTSHQMFSSFCCLLQQTGLFQSHFKVFSLMCK